jgi:Flp pilus assembly protein TadG
MKTKVLRKLGGSAPLKALRRRLGELARQEAGSSLMFTALALPVVLGMAGLGFDATLWYMTKRQNQTVADNAVLAAVVEMTRNPGVAQTDIEQEVWSDANRNNFYGSATHRISVNRPPLAGTFAGDNAYVEVVVEEDRDVYLASFVTDGQVTIAAWSVGGITSFGEHCLLALDPTVDAALEFTGTSDVSLNCGIASNSSSQQSVLVNGNADLQADPAQAVGDFVVSGSGTMTTTTPPQPHSAPVPDPYAGTTLPVSASLSCDYNNKKAKNETLDPGVYCNGLDMKFAITLNPGVYIIKGGDLSINANAQIQGDGVTFIFLADTPSNTGGISNINGNANVALTAPGPEGHIAGTYYGEYPGLLFVQDPGALSTQVNRMNGGASMQMSGALYFPSTEVNYTGGSDLSAGCIKIVARKITFSGNSYLNADSANCAAQGVAEIQQTRVRVVE